MADKLKTPRIVVVGAEKGGAGKSTIAIHVAAGLLHKGANVAVMDLDLRQQSVGHFFSTTGRSCSGRDSASASTASCSAG